MQKIYSLLNQRVQHIGSETISCDKDDSLRKIYCSANDNYLYSNDENISIIDIINFIVCWIIHLVARGIIYCIIRLFFRKRTRVYIGLPAVSHIPDFGDATSAAGDAAFLWGMCISKGDDTSSMADDRISIGRCGYTSKIRDMWVHLQSPGCVTPLLY